MVGESPADDLPAPRVEHDGEEDEARRSRDVRDVGDPEPVARRGREVALERSGAGRASVSRTVVVAKRRRVPLQAEAFISRASASPYVHALGRQLGVHARRP